MSTQHETRNNNPSKKRKTLDKPNSQTNPTRPTEVPNPILDTISFRSNASPITLARFDEYFNNRTPHLERGINFEKCSPKIQELITFHKWDKIALPRKSTVNLTVVAEFFATLAEVESLENVKTVKVRSIDVPFSPTIINKFFKVPEIPSNTLYDKKWELDSPTKLEAKAKEVKSFLSSRGTWKNKSFQFGSASKDVKVMKHFVNHNIYSNTHICAFTYEEACLVYGIMKKEPVDIGQIIFKRAHDFAIKRRKDDNLPYPSFVSSLCCRNKVQPSPTDLVVDPCKVLIGVHIFEPKSDSNDELPQPPTQGSIPVNENEPNPPPLQNLAYEARFNRLDNEMAIVRGEIAALSSNVLKGFEQFGKICDDLRTGIMGHREFSALALKKKALDDGFDDCQEDDYVVGPWDSAVPIHPSQPSLLRSTPLASGGVSGSTFAGTGSEPHLGAAVTTNLGEESDVGLQEPVAMTTSTETCIQTLVDVALTQG